MGLPTSATMMCRSSSLCAARAAWNCSRQRRRKAWSVAHVVSSKARRARGDGARPCRPGAVGGDPQRPPRWSGSMLSKVAPRGRLRPACRRSAGGARPAPPVVSSAWRLGHWSSPRRGWPAGAGSIRSARSLCLHHFAVLLPGQHIDELDRPGVACSRPAWWPAGPGGRRRRGGRRDGARPRRGPADPSARRAVRRRRRRPRRGPRPGPSPPRPGRRSPRRRG